MTGILVPVSKNKSKNKSKSKSKSIGLSFLSDDNVNVLTRRAGAR